MLIVNEHITFVVNYRRRQIGPGLYAFSLCNSQCNGRENGLPPGGKRIRKYLACKLSQKEKWRLCGSQI